MAQWLSAYFSRTGSGAMTAAHSHLYLTPVYLTSSDLCGVPCSHVVHRHTRRQHTHTQINKSKKKNLLN